MDEYTCGSPEAAEHIGHKLSQPKGLYLDTKNKQIKHTYTRVGDLRRTYVEVLSSDRGQ